MSERRTPFLSVQVVHKNGQKVRVELFEAVLWGGKKGLPPRSELENKYRLRVDGKWFSSKSGGGRYQFVTFWQFRDKFFQALKKMAGVGRGKRG